MKRCLAVISTFFLTLLALAALGPAQCRAAEAGRTFAVGDHDFLLDGKPLEIRCGEIHAARVPRQYWQHRLKMCKAMGLNAVCAYLFWNMHEPRPGEFDFSGQADAAEFCRIAQREGLWVILRPGPYACAEWEMGGLPWWLLKNPDVKPRTRDPRFLGPAKAWLKEVGRQLASLQVTRGGPIIMVQVENEYGSFGKDAAYMGDIRRALIDAGFTVPLFACNPPADLQKAPRADIFNVVNFGSDPAGAFRKLREVQPRGPLMCGEFYPSWFDTWGAEHHQKDGRDFLRDLKYMLDHKESFSIYMAHGGTTFGLWSGADHPFKPDTSSYDYDAPISEAGWATEKFKMVREAIAAHLPAGETLPAPPAANPAIAVRRFNLAQCAPLCDNLPPPIIDRAPRAMEAYDQSRGCILYRTQLPAGPAGYLDVGAVHDFGWVWLDGKPIGVFDRRSRQYHIALPAVEKPACLDILVEAMGRVNFGPDVCDRKGIHAPVTLARGGNNSELENWQVFCLPLDDAQRQGLHYASEKKEGPAFWRGRFQLNAPGDTFLDLRSWGKGVVWVNGHCLGRFWNIGPTQTMYLPGPWLKRGENEVVVFDLLGPSQAGMAGLKRPILDQLRPEADFSTPVGKVRISPRVANEYVAQPDEIAARAAPPALAGKSDMNSIRSGTVWTDTRGEIINAHGIGMLRVGDAYYWFGEVHLDNRASRSIRCYASTDLKHWTFKNTVLSRQSAPALADANFERPKVVYNQRTKKYVLWAHKENSRGYSEARAIVATCDTPDGNYRYVKDFRPFGNESRDCTLYKDDDGSAYFISSTRGNTDLVCYRLTDNYLDVKEQSIMLKGARREAPAVFKRNGVYFLITSACTGWGPNGNTYATSRRIDGRFGPMKVLCSGKTWNTYCSQSAFVLPVHGARGTTYVFMSDRWKGWNLRDSRYIFLPIQFGDDGSLVPLEWTDAWDVDAATGQCAYPKPFKPSPRNIALGKTCIASVSDRENGNEARAAFDGNDRTRWCANDGDYPHWLKVDLGKSLPVSRSEIDWEAKRGRIYKYVIESSDDDKTWKRVVDQSHNEREGETGDNCSAKGRYFRLTVLDVELPRGGYAWASVCEWRLFSGGRNVALDRPATADSQQNGTYAAKANDGDFDTTWFTGEPTLGNWWKVDLGEPHDLTGCRLMWHDPGFCYQYKIETSADDAHWTTVVDKTRNAETKWVPVHAFTAKDARYLRVTATGLENGCWLGIREVEVFDTLPLPADAGTNSK